MLLLMITVLALLSAVGVYFCGGLVAAVAAFIGGWIAWLILAALLLVLACAVVDKEKEQENDSAFYRWLVHLWLDFLICVGRVKIKTRGVEHIPGEGRFLLVCNHLCDIDPALLMHCFPKSQLAFIGKKETKDMPLVGAVMHKLLCQLIDRENDREALKTILKCIEIIKEDKASVAVFPEGYCSLDGQLRHFRGGVFKIAQRTGVPIVVCTVTGTRQAMKKLLKLQPSEVTLHVVDVIPGEEAKATATMEMAERVYEIMISDLGEERRCNEKGMHPDLQTRPENW